MKISQRLNESYWIISRFFRHFFASRNAIFIIQYLFLPIVITKRNSSSSSSCQRLYILFLFRSTTSEKCNNFSSLTTQIYLKLPAIKWTFKIILLAPWKKRHHHFHPPAKEKHVMSSKKKKHNIKKNYKNKISTIVLKEHLKDKWEWLRSCLLWITRLRPDSELESSAQQRLIC